ncbi:MAG: hypothetical protein HY327_06860 [Chloroflexi bacterium]|nr:hypothetical protein [Chloroflexota bacterium]
MKSSKLLLAFLIVLVSACGSPSEQEIEQRVQATLGAKSTMEAAVKATVDAELRTRVPPTAPATPSPSAAPTQPAAFFEDFERDLGGKVDTARWNVGGNDSQVVATQKDGKLRLSGSAGKKDAWGGTVVSPSQYNSVPLNRLGVVESKLMIASDHTGGTVQMHMKIFVAGGETWRAANCGITADENRQPRAMCIVEDGNAREGFVGAPVAYDEWHTFRIEVDPKTPEIYFYLDGELLGSQIPSAKAWSDPAARFGIQLWAGRYSGASATTYADYFLIKNNRERSVSFLATPPAEANATITPSPARALSPTATRLPPPAAIANACQDPKAKIPLDIPLVDLRVGRVVKVTTASDAQNGDVKSVDALNANPGSDGISLREAIAATNNTPEAETIEFASELKGSVIQVGSSRKEGLVLTGGWLIINGDINGDGEPDITLDGSLGQPANPPSTTGIAIASSYNVINALNFVNFAWAGIILKPCGKQPCSERVLYGNRILRNVISGSGGFGIATEQAGVGKEASDIGWEDTLIAGNVVKGVKENAIYLMAAFAGASRNRIVNTTVVANRISSSAVAVGIFAGDTATDWSGHPEPIRGLSPVQYSDANVIQNTIVSGNSFEGIGIRGILIEASNMGNRNNSVRCAKIIRNTITQADIGMTIGVVSESGSRETNDNLVDDVEIGENTFKDVRNGIEFSSGNEFGDKTGGNVVNNKLTNMTIRDNIIQDYKETGLLAWAANTCNSTYGSLDNSIQRLAVRGNTLLAQTGRSSVGIHMTGGWGCRGLASGNGIEDLNISNNVIKDSNTGIWLAGGTGVTAKNNRIKAVLQGNKIESKEPTRISNNDDGASGNTVEVTTP